MTEASTQSASYKNKKNLVIVLSFTSIYLIAEVIGGILTKSLALLADAGHMLTDVGGLAITLLAIHIAQKKANAERTYGYYRAEIFGSMVNAVVLISLSFYILFEAYQRFRAPPEVKSGGMLIVAGIGLIVNLAGVKLLKSASNESLNMKGAYFEVLSDLLTSIGVIIGAVIIHFTSWNWIDPVISAAIGFLIFPRTWALLKEAASILLEGTPVGIDIKEIRSEITSVPGVKSIHDLHVWSLTSGKHVLTAHVEVGVGADRDGILDRTRSILSDKFKIEHITIQTEAINATDNDGHA
ncbi:MAG: cation transporter [Bdellovibrionales bacterium]|nr:cation transporter [Bdellovibrionales bacterium]